MKDDRGNLEFVELTEDERNYQLHVSDLDEMIVELEQLIQSQRIDSYRIMSLRLGPFEIQDYKDKQVIKELKEYLDDWQEQERHGATLFEVVKISDVEFHLVMQLLPLVQLGQF